MCILYVNMINKKMFFVNLYYHYYIILSVKQRI